MRLRKRCRREVVAALLNGRLFQFSRGKLARVVACDNGASSVAHPPAYLALWVVWTIAEWQDSPTGYPALRLDGTVSGGRGRTYDESEALGRAAARRVRVGDFGRAGGVRKRGRRPWEQQRVPRSPATAPAEWRLRPLTA